MRPTASRRLAELEGYTLIPPFDDVEVIAGQGTIGKELLEQDTHLTHVFVPVGGGGLAAGVAVYIKQLLPDVKVIGVEAEGSACLKAALAASRSIWSGSRCLRTGWRSSASARRPSACATSIWTRW